MSTTFWTRERRATLRTLDQHLADAERINRPANSRQVGDRFGTFMSRVLLVVVVGYALGSVLALPTLLVVWAINR